MAINKLEIVHALPTSKDIVRIENEITIGGIKKIITKYTILDDNGIATILDKNEYPSGIQYFDTYEVNEEGDIIIGIRKTGEDYLRIFSILDFKGLDQELIKIIQGKLGYNYGLIRRDGILTIYPQFDHMKFGMEDTCIVAEAKSLTTTVFGYNDIISGYPITPVCFKSAGKFNDSRALVKYKGKYGYIDRSKVMKDPKNNCDYANNLHPQYINATDFKDGIATVVTSCATPFERSRSVKVGVSGNTLEILPPKRVLRKRNNADKEQ